jgi:hypothetical protein
MKDIIIDKLSKMEDLEQRKILKDIISGVFLNLIDYQESFNKNLEERIFSEIEDKEKRYDVYVTVNNIENIDRVDDFLYPIISTDLEEKKNDAGKIYEKLIKNEEVCLYTVFMNCDYLKIKEIMRSKKKYTGEIITDNQKYKIKVKLEQNKSYINEIENLYEIFQKNSFCWKTINNPYANKFFDVIITDCEALENEENEIKEINIDFEEIEEYKMTDVIPLWNVKRMSVKSDGFPMPALDRVNFEHLISLKKLGLDNGYLVDENEGLVKYVMRTSDSLTIVSPEEKASSWNILKISGQGKEQERKLQFELVSNSRKKSFINKFAQKNSQAIRTKGEIARIVNSFEVSKYFELTEIEIIDSKPKRGTTYDMNYFIIDDIRVAKDKKVMNLKFKANKDSIIIYDLLSFIISEIQMYFPEYQCEGELV